MTNKGVAGVTKFVTDEMLDNWFGYHAPSSPAIIEAHETIRAKYNELAKDMNALLAEGPDKTVALRAIRDAAMLANAHVACSQKLYGDK